MKRLLTDQLVAWQKQETRKPLLLDGARQVDKSYLVEHIFGGQFRTVRSVFGRLVPLNHRSPRIGLWLVYD